MIYSSDCKRKDKYKKKEKEKNCLEQISKLASAIKISLYSKYFPVPDPEMLAENRREKSGAAGDRQARSQLLITPDHDVI